MKKWLTNRRFWINVGALLMFMGLIFPTPLLVSAISEDPGCLSFLLIIPSFIRIGLSVFFFCSVFLGGALMNVEGHFNEKVVTYFKKKFNQIEEEFKYAKGLFYETEKGVARAKREREQLITSDISRPKGSVKEKREVSISYKEAIFWATLGRIRDRLQNYFTEKLIIYYDEYWNNDYYAISKGSFKIVEINRSWGFTDLKISLYPNNEEQIAIVKEELRQYKEWFQKESKCRINLGLTLHIKHGFPQTKEEIVKTNKKKVSRTDGSQPGFPYKKEFCLQHDFSKEVGKTLFGKLPVSDGVRLLYLKTLECTQCGKKKIENEWGEYIKIELKEQL